MLETPVFRIDAPAAQVTRLTRRGHVRQRRARSPTGGVVFTSNGVRRPTICPRRPRAAGIAADRRQPRAPGAARPGAASSFSFKRRQRRHRVGHEAQARRARRGKLPMPSSSTAGRRAASTTPGPTAGTRACSPSQGYARGLRRFPRLHRLRPGLHRRDPQRLGRQAARGSAEGPGRRHRQDPQIDGDNACAMGASYGGYMMNWIEGKWPDRFKCLVQHDGVFDARAMAYETEELWFDEWEHGGKTYYEDPAAYERWNPVNHVAKWKTPMLVITGEKDFRIPYTQGSPPSPRCSAAASRRSCWCSRTRTTGCSSRRTRSSGTTTCSAGWTGGWAGRPQRRSMRALSAESTSVSRVRKADPRLSDREEVDAAARQG